MKHALLVVACAALLVGIALAPHQVVADAPRGVPRWEYATLSFGVVERKAIWSFIGPVEADRVEGETADFYKKLTGKTKALFDKTEVFNVIGNNGWELVTTEVEVDSVSKITRYHFKRPKI